MVEVVTFELCAQSTQPIKTATYITDIRFCCLIDRPCSANQLILIIQISLNLIELNLRPKAQALAIGG